MRALSFAETQRFDCGSRRNKQFPDQVPVPGARMPLLDEVLKAFRGSKVEFLVETKMEQDGDPHFVPPARFVDLLYKVLAANGFQKRVIIESFDHRTLAEFRRRDPAVRLCLLNPREHLPDYVSPARKLGAHSQLINYRIILPEDVKRLHAAGIQVFSGTTSDPAEWKRLREMGVDGILTDDPAGLLAQRR